MRRAVAILSAGLCALFISQAAAQPTLQQPLRAEIDYRVISPQPVPAGSGIEVIDFFWYGCPYCNRLRPALERWVAKKPEDVTLRRVPVVLRDTWAPHARIYYTLEALGEVERLHQQVYHGYHVEELFMSRPEVMSQWAVRHGIERERWEAAYNSEEVLLKVKEASRLTQAYGINGTPSLVVNGRYLTSGNMTETLDGMIPVLDALVRLMRLQGARY